MFVKSVIVCRYICDCKWLQIKYEDWKKKKKKKKKKSALFDLTAHVPTKVCSLTGTIYESLYVL